MEHFTNTPNPTDNILRQRNLTISEYQNRIQSAQEEINRLNSQIETSESNISNLNNSISNLNSNWSRESEELSQLINETTTRLENRNTDIQNLIDSDRTNRQQLQNRLNNLNAEVNSSCSSLPGYENVNNSLLELQEQQRVIRNRRENHRTQFMNDFYQPWEVSKDRIDEERDEEINIFNIEKGSCIQECNIIYDSNMGGLDPIQYPDEPIMDPLPTFPANLNSNITQATNNRNEICSNEELRLRNILGPEIEELSSNINNNEVQINNNRDNLNNLSQQRLQAERDYNTGLQNYRREISELEEEITNTLNLRNNQQNLINELNDLIQNVNTQIENYTGARDTLRDLIRDENARLRRLSELGIEDDSSNLELRINRWRFIWNSFTPDERLVLGIPDFNPLEIPNLSLLENIENYNLNNITDLLSVRRDLSNLLGDAGNVDFSSFFPEPELPSIPIDVSGPRDDEFTVGFRIRMKYSTLAIIIIVCLIVGVIIYFKFFKND